MNALSLDGFLLPPEQPSKPRRSPPAGATDCHAHVIGPFDRFPLATERHCSPAEMPAQRYLGMLDRIGFTRGVLVQPSVHGTDCGAMLHALERDRVRLRGIALLDPQITDEALDVLHRKGVRGARFARPPGILSKGSVGFEALEQLAPRLAELGWHAEIWAPCDLLAAVLPRLTTLGLPIVIDHMGYFDVNRGLADPSFQSLLRWLSEGRIWLKLGAYRLSSRFPDYDDVVPFHKALLEANYERLIWGSDWPHARMPADMPDVGHLVDLLDRWTGNDTVRQRILVENPAKLYDF